MDQLDILKALIKQALETGFSSKFDLSIECNGGVLFYAIGLNECTGTQALEYAEANF